MFIQSQKDIEEYICFSLEASKNGGINFSQTEKKINYKDDLKNSSYDDFLDYGILHYQVARILFFHHLINYSFFSAHQAIENISLEGNPIEVQVWGTCDESNCKFSIRWAVLLSARR